MRAVKELSDAVEREQGANALISAELQAGSPAARPLHAACPSFLTASSINRISSQGQRNLTVLHTSTSSWCGKKAKSAVSSKPLVATGRGWSSACAQAASSSSAAGTRC